MRRLFEWRYWPDGFHHVLAILLMECQGYARSLKGLQLLCFGGANREGMLRDCGGPLTCSGCFDRRNADGYGVGGDLFDDTRRDSAL